MSDNKIYDVIIIGAEYAYGDIKEIIDHGHTKTVIAGTNEYTAYAVVIATGAEYKKLDIPGEESLVGRSIIIDFLYEGILNVRRDLLCLRKESEREIVQ